MKFDLISSVYSKYKLSNTFGKVLIISFFALILFNVFPIKFNDASWASNISLYIVDTGIIFILGIWMLNYSITNLKLAFNLIEEDPKIKFPKNINLDQILSKIKLKNKIVKFTNIFFVLVIIGQFFIFLSGMNFIDASASFNLQELEKNYQVAAKEFPKDLIENTESIENLKKNKKDAETTILTLANNSKLELIKQRIKVILITILYLVGFNLINSIEN